MCAVKVPRIRIVTWHYQYFIDCWHKKLDVLISIHSNVLNVLCYTKLVSSHCGLSGYWDSCGKQIVFFKKEVLITFWRILQALLWLQYYLHSSVVRQKNIVESACSQSPTCHHYLCRHWRRCPSSSACPWVSAASAATPRRWSCRRPTPTRTAVRFPLQGDQKVQKMGPFAFANEVKTCHSKLSCVILARFTIPRWPH